MYAIFNASGVVRDIQNEKTQSGMEGVSVLIKVGEWQGQRGGGEDLLRVTLWNDRQEMARGVNVGDAVSVSGRISSKQSNSGFWNVRLSVTELLVIGKSQPQGGYQQPVQQQPVQQQPTQAYSDADIPFN